MLLSLATSKYANTQKSTFFMTRNFSTPFVSKKLPKQYYVMILHQIAKCSEKISMKLYLKPCNYILMLTKPGLQCLA